jgi:hypothetical protein
MKILRILTVLLFWLCAALNAQMTDASLSGIVTDSQAAIVPAAQVVVLNETTGVRSTAQTNEAGFYSLRPLAIGRYTLQVTRPGFRVHSRTGVVLTTGQSMEMNVTLEVGSVTESVTVEERSSLLETRTSDAGQLVEAKTIEDMPLGDRRAMNLVEITGAAVFVGYEGGGKPNFSLAGGRSQSQMMFIDGGTGQNMRLGIGQMDIDPPVETLSEVKILANGFSAEFGGSASGVVIANTKSGTNRIRGSLFEYFRNQVLDAPNFFSPIVNGEKSKPALRYNVFGGTVGGPVIRDRTFYFAAFEGSRRRDGSVRTLTVPSALQRAGDFSQTFNARGLMLIYDPLTGTTSGTSVKRQPFPKNVISADRFDKVTLGLVPFYPTPNRPADDVTGANNFRANDVNALTRDNWLAKLDHNLTAKDRLYGRYMSNTDDQARSSIYPVPAADTVNQGDNWQSNLNGSWTRIVSPSLINEVRGTYTRRRAISFSRGYGENWPSKLGFQNVSDDAFPNIVPAGFASLGSSSQERRQTPIEQFQIVDNASWVRGRNTMKFGGEIRPSMNHEIFRPYASGRYAFSRGLTGLPGNSQTGNGFATMLLGTPNDVQVRETEPLDRMSWYGAAFAQMDWNPRAGLTLNLGLRWEVDTPLHDLNNKVNGFDATRINPVSGTLGVVRFAGIDGFRERPYNIDLNNFGPRIGFAWQPDGMPKVVVRGAWGVFFAHPFDRAVANAASLGYEISANLNILDNVLVPPYYLDTGLPLPPPTKPPLNDSFGAVPLGSAATHTITVFEENRRTGYSMQHNLRVQYELPGGTLMEAGYLGNLSRKLAASNLSLNQILPSLVLPTANQRNRPYPQFSNVQLLGPSLGVSNYHAAMVKVEKRFARGFNILSTYTWAKFLDNCDSAGGSLGDEGNSFSNLYNRRPDYGPSENDIRNRFTLSSVWRLPFGRGRNWLSSGPLSALAGGWGVGVVMMLQSGPPMTVTTQTNTTFAYSSGPQRADILRNPNLPADARSVGRWFDTSAFVQPATNMFGNQGVGQVRSGGVVNLNLSAIRTFRIRERYALQFRGEFFNAPNHPNFGNPGRVFEGPGFGVISSARAGRQVQLGLRLAF